MAPPRSYGNGGGDGQGAAPATGRYGSVLVLGAAAALAFTAVILFAARAPAGPADSSKWSVSVKFSSELPEMVQTDPAKIPVAELPGCGDTPMYEAATCHECSHALIQELHYCTACLADTTTKVSTEPGSPGFVGQIAPVATWCPGTVIAPAAGTPIAPMAIAAPAAPAAPLAPLAATMPSAPADPAVSQPAAEKSEKVLPRETVMVPTVAMEESNKQSLKVIEDEMMSIKASMANMAPHSAEYFKARELYVQRKLQLNQLVVTIGGAFGGHIKPGALTIRDAASVSETSHSAARATRVREEKQAPQAWKAPASWGVPEMPAAAPGENLSAVGIGDVDKETDIPAAPAAPPAPAAPVTAAAAAVVPAAPAATVAVAAPMAPAASAAVATPVAVPATAPAAVPAAVVPEAPAAPIAAADVVEAVAPTVLAPPPSATLLDQQKAAPASESKWAAVASQLQPHVDALSQEKSRVELLAELWKKDHEDAPAPLDVPAATKIHDTTVVPTTVHAVKASPSPPVAAAAPAPEAAAPAPLAAAADDVATRQFKLMAGLAALGGQIQQLNGVLTGAFVLDPGWFSIASVRASVAISIPATF